MFRPVFHNLYPSFACLVGPCLIWTDLSGRGPWDFWCHSLGYFQLLGDIATFGWHFPRLFGHTDDYDETTFWFRFNTILGTRSNLESSFKFQFNFFWTLIQFLERRILVSDAITGQLGFNFFDEPNTDFNIPSVRWYYDGPSVETLQLSFNKDFSANSSFNKEFKFYSGAWILGRLVSNRM